MLPGKSLHVGLALWYLVGLKKTNTVALEPDSEVHVAGFGLGSVRRFSMTDIMASLAKPSAMIVMAS
jgi:hypothetical protein